MLSFYKMTTQIASSKSFSLTPKSKPSTLTWHLRLIKIATNLFYFIQALEHLNVRIEGKTVILTHDVGTEIKLREDGNIDVVTERNFVQKTKGLLYLNPEKSQDDYYTSYEDLVRAYPERFNQSH